MEIFNPYDFIYFIFSKKIIFLYRNNISDERFFLSSKSNKEVESLEIV